MNLLLDTHVFLWALMDTGKLSPTAREKLLDPENKVFVSSVTFLEIALKHSLGKLDLEGLAPGDLPHIASRKMGLNLLSLDATTASSAGIVPVLHKDPFDRMLIHQAIAQGFDLVSADEHFPKYGKYGLNLIW